MRIKAALGAVILAALALVFQVLAGPGDPARAAFPGVPGLIAVQRSSGWPDSSGIWLLDWRSGTATQLTHKGFAREPAFSPDGEWVAFVSDASPRGYINVWAIRADGTGLRRLTNGKGPLEAESPAFSADGRWIAFTAEGPGGREIDRIPFSGGHRVALVPAKGKIQAGEPAYSPDGRKIAWVEFSENLMGQPQIYVGHTDGSHARRVTDGANVEFSPDGRNIVFVRGGRCPDGRLGGEVDLRSLQSDVTQRIAYLCGGELASPTFSPDGGWIAYTVWRGEKSEIAFAPVPGVSSSIALATGPGADLLGADPSWQPAG